MKFQSALLMCLCAVAYCQQEREYSTQNKATILDSAQSKTIDAQFGGTAKARADSAQLSAIRDRVNIAFKNHQEKLMAQASGKTAIASNGGAPVQAMETAAGKYQAVSDGKTVDAAQTSNGVNANTANQKTAAVVNGDQVRAMQMEGRAAKTAAAQLTKDGQVVKGGSANQGDNTARIDNSVNNGVKTSDMVANNQYNAKAAAPSRDTFNAMTSDAQNADSKGVFGAKTGAITADEVNADLKANVKKGAGEYAAHLEQENGVGQAQLDQIGAGSGVLAQRTSGWKCSAEKDGQSNCVDANGKQVGKVITNANGEATVIDNNGVVKGRGKVVKVNEQQYQVIVSDGLALAKTERIQQKDCYADVVPGGSQEHKIVIENVKAMVDGQEVDAQGGKTYSWPTCFDIVADVTIPAGVDPSRLAFEYLGHVMPLGTMKCMDSLTCGKGCYYCNACDKEALLADAKSLFVGDSNPVCSIHGGGKQTVKMTVCPPEDVGEYAYCGGFDRHIVGNDYYKYDGSINAQIRVWLRPENEEALRTKFFSQVANSLGKSILIGEYKVDNKVVADPDNQSLLNWFILKRGVQTLMACRQGIIDYSIGGSDVNSNIMIDAFTNLPGKNIQLLSDAPCEAWVAAQQKEYNAYQQEYQQAQGAAPASTNLFSGLSSLFGKSSTGGIFSRRA